MAIERLFQDDAALAARLAQDITARLTTAAAARGEASLVATGGSTPGGLYDALNAQSDLPWHRLWVTLTDERWVSPDSPSSNERLVRARLLKGRAAARFVPLKTVDSTPAEAEASVNATLAAMPRPFDAVVLGVGPDGHFASLFPGNPALARGLDPAADRRVIAVTADGAAGATARLSMTLRAVLDSRWIAIIIRGEDKLAMVRMAAAEPEAGLYPVSAVLAQTKVPVEVFWAP
ncbi:6-phosphogluconolactonase [soil metagenome]